MKTALIDRRRARTGSLIVALVAAALACSPRVESVADYEVKIAVKRYNEMLPQAYARGSAGVLAGTATPDEMRRVDDIILFLAQGGMKMDARQETFTAGPVEHVDSAGAEVARAAMVATEQWWYRHVIPATGEVKQEPRRVIYTNRYSLVRVDGRWLVDKLEEQGFENVEKKSRPVPAPPGAPKRR